VENLESIKRGKLQILQTIKKNKLRSLPQFWGKVLEEGQKKGEIASKGESKYNSLITEGNKRTLTDIGISAKESSTFQTIANMTKYDTI
jgi:hypothetical protein